MTTPFLSLSYEAFSSQLGSRIRQFRQSGGYSAKALAQELGISKSSITNWETGLNRPDLGMILRLCALLSITPDQLLGYTEPSSIEEQQLVSRFRELTPQNRKNLLGFARIMVDGQNEERIRICRESFSYIPIAEDKVCAGSGIDLGSEVSRESLPVRITLETRKCDLIVTITGDSMEPLYHPGENILLQLTPVLQPGEIGVFSINGSGTLKQYFPDRLHPLNPAYPDIPANGSDEFRCIGRVICPLTEDLCPTEEEAEFLAE